MEKLPTDSKDHRRTTRYQTRHRRKRAFLSGIIWTACACLVLIIGLLAFIHFSNNYGLYVVRSESMARAVNLGDLVVTGPVGDLPGATNKIKIGSVIAYTTDKGTTLHRIVGITNDGLFLTKGDRSEASDPVPVELSQIVGLYIFHIPYLGRIADFVRTPLGWCMSIILPTCIIVFLIVVEIVREIKKYRSRRYCRDAHREMGGLDTM